MPMHPERRAQNLFLIRAKKGCYSKEDLTEVKEVIERQLKGFLDVR